jgi:hypothetical protein
LWSLKKHAIVLAASPSEGKTEQKSPNKGHCPLEPFTSCGIPHAGPDRQTDIQAERGKFLAGRGESGVAQEGAIQEVIGRTILPAISMGNK